MYEIPRMVAQIYFLEPESLRDQIIGNLDNITRCGYLLTKKNEDKPKFIPAKLMNDSILSKVKKSRMKLEFVYLSSKRVPGSPGKKYKTESRWLVKQVLTYRSKVWGVLVVGQCEGTQFRLTIISTLRDLLPKYVAKKMKTEIKDPESSVNDFFHNMMEHVPDHGLRWVFKTN